MLMDVLLIATGFSGALTLAWLSRLVLRLFRRPPSAVVCFAPGTAPVDAVVRELAAARREVLLLAGALACRPIAQALVDARLRRAQVDVLLTAAAQADAGSDLHFLVEQGLVPLLADAGAGLCGLLVVIDGKTVVSGSVDLTTAEVPAGQVLVVRGHPALATSCRQRFVALRGSAHPVGAVPQEARSASDEESSRPAPRPATRPKPESPARRPASLEDQIEPRTYSVPVEQSDLLRALEEPLPTSGVPSHGAAPSEDMLAAVARGICSTANQPDEAEEEDHPTSPAPTVTRATAELFARLRREVAAAEQDDSTEKAA